VLTPTGKEAFEQIYPSHVARVTDLMSPLSAREQVVLADLLSRVADQAAAMDR